METSQMSKSPAAARMESHGFRHFVASWYTPRRGLILAGLGIVLAGLALGWNWLSAIGLAPLILSLAPCAAMCALGICMSAGIGSPRPKPDSVETTKLPGTGSPSVHSGE
jgi:hypothetical protein